LSDRIDTGFDAVLAGEIWNPEPVVTATVTEDPPCPTFSQSDGTNTGPSASTPASVISAEPDAISASASLSPAGVQAAKVLVQLPKGLDWPTLSRLAREVAMNIKEMPDILMEFGLTQTQYDFLEAYNEFYRGALAAACKDWQSPRSTQERLQVEAAAILEDSLLGLGARMQHKGEPLPAAIEAAKLFAKIAGVGEREQSAIPSGERFVINIDLGGDTKVSVGVTPPSAPNVGGDSSGPLPQIDKGS